MFFFQNYKWGVCLCKNPNISAIFARKSKNYMRYEISSKRSFKCDQPEYCSIRRLEMRAGRIQEKLKNHKRGIKLCQSHFCKDRPVPGRKFISQHPQMEQMLSLGYNKTSAQSCEQLCNIFWHTENIKSLNASGRSPFFTIISSFFEVFFPLIPAQTFFRRPVIKARISYYSWRLIEAIQGFNNCD